MTREDGLTVFSDGKIRPALRTPYFPRPFDAACALYSEFYANITRTPWMDWLRIVKC